MIGHSTNSRLHGTLIWFDGLKPQRMCFLSHLLVYLFIFSNQENLPIPNQVFLVNKLGGSTDILLILLLTMICHCTKNLGQRSPMCQPLSLQCFGAMESPPARRSLCPHWRSNPFLSLKLFVFCRNLAAESAAARANSPHCAPAPGWRSNFTASACRGPSATTPFLSTVIHGNQSLSS